jgi:hypothetical protein
MELDVSMMRELLAEASRLQGDEVLAETRSLILTYF